MSKETDRRIKLGGGYWLCNDPYCCWISKEYTTKEGKHQGETYLRRCSGYTANIGDALESFCERHMRECNAKSVNSLIKEIKSLKTLLNTFRGNV